MVNAIDQPANKASAELVLRELRTFWSKYGREGRRIIAVSGGVDSMVLLEGLHRILSDADERARLLVLHVNHALRGAESDADEALVRTRVGALGLAFESRRLEWRERPSQEKCRKARENIFAELCRHSADRVLLAHHQNDQAETIFLRLLRGTGAKGLAGMRISAGRKLRPFLGLEKTTLRSAANHWRVSWREDQSNQDTAHYERNWLRHEIIPLLEARRPGFSGRLAGLAQEAQGWKIQSPALPLFVLEEGVAFARPEAPVSADSLRETFALSRLHCRELENLLEKPAGTLHAERIRFTWSSGILLAEKGARFSAGAVRSSRAEDKTIWESELGTWEIPGEMDFSAGARASGERLKKEFQAHRVPIFFRRSVPVLRRANKAFALLPLSRYAPAACVPFRPSALGTWWLGRRD